MNEFFIPYIAIGVSCTLFCFWRLARWLGWRLWLVIPALPLTALCFWFPISKHLNLPALAQEALVWAGSTWMVLIVFFSGTIIFLEILRALFWFYVERGEGEGRDILPPRRTVPLALLILLAFTCYSAFEAQNVRATHIAIQTDKLPEGMNHYRIAFVADMHLNWFTGQKMVDRVTKIIKNGQPDLLLFGGDIVSAHNMNSRPRESAALAGAMPPGGSLGVLGNHEAYYDHAGNAIPFLKRAWVHVMRGEAITVGSIYIVGVDDPEIAAAQGSTVHDPMVILERMPRERFVILLKHRPDVTSESIGYFDLQLSGHTHGGQIWPAKYVVEKLYGVPQGKLASLEGLNGQSWYYNTNGAGFNALPLRFFTPPEVVFVDLIR